MEIFNYLGEFLSLTINISLPAARGLIKLAIKKEMIPDSFTCRNNSYMFRLTGSPPAAGPPP